MALLTRIYFNAVFGALGGLLGWMLFGVFADRNQLADDSKGVFWLALLFGGVLIGGAIGYFVVSVEAWRDRSLLRFVRLSSYGVILGALGGAIGMVAAEWVNFEVNRLLIGMKVDPGGAIGFLMGAFARGLGWMCLGAAVGVSEGIAARSLGKLSYGTLGGTIGGFVGGAFFGGVFLATRDMGAAASPWEAVGLVILGACIGSLSAFVQGVFQPASVKVMRGWQEGREYPLEKRENLLGRDEHADIALFRDMKVEKRHAVIQRQGNVYYLVNNGSPAEWTRVNEEPVRDQCVLHDGDRIQLGNVLLRFQMRAAQARGQGPGVRGRRRPYASSAPDPFPQTIRP
ncbi:MAG TPA: FHA domain-containing protein [Gemmataceae bacterium]|nr:FHA domain-containing protein [Gemmataceae bacterium]